MSKNIKDNEKESAWAISLGLYPGILFGVRTYEEPNVKIHVFYLPFVDLAIEIYK